MRSQGRQVEPEVEGDGCIGYRVERYNRYFAVKDAAGTLVVVAVYRRGAEEVARRLGEQTCSRCGSAGCSSR